MTETCETIRELIDSRTFFLFLLFFCYFFLFVFSPVLNNVSICLFSLTYTSRQKHAENIFIIYYFCNASLWPRKNWSVYMKRRGRQGELHWFTNVHRWSSKIRKFILILDVKLVRLYFRVAGQSFHQHAVQSDQWTKTYPLINN